MSRNLLKSRGFSRISADLRFIGVNPRSPVVRLHAIHLVVGGDDELVQGVAIDAEGGSPNADPDACEAVPAEWHRKLRHRAFDAHTQVFNLRAHHLLHERDKLVATATR